MIESGTDWRLEARVKIEMEPTAMREAMAVRKRRAIEFMDKVKVLGSEILTTSQTVFQSKLMLKRGNRLLDTRNGTCIRACINAPNTTPSATPITPILSANNTIPKIIPALYRTGAMA